MCVASAPHVGTRNSSLCDFFPRIPKKVSSMKRDEIQYYSSLVSVSHSFGNANAAPFVL